MKKLTEKECQLVRGGVCVCAFDLKNIAHRSTKCEINFTTNVECRLACCTTGRSEGYIFDGELFDCSGKKIKTSWIRSVLSNCCSWNGCCFF